MASFRKGQFYILTAVAVATILFFISRWIQPVILTDTSSVVLSEEAFTFDNIKEKAANAVSRSENCDDLHYNLQEYKNFVDELALEKNYKIELEYFVTPCTEETGAVVEFNLRITSINFDAKSTFFTFWP